MPLTQLLIPYNSFRPRGMPVNSLVSKEKFEKSLIEKN